MHRDSLGTELEIKPGAVNWMTAGKGIVHSERTPEYLRHSDKMLHGLQIWVALPKELEQMDPNFTHVEADDIPAWEEDGVSYKLIAGEAFGKNLQFLFIVRCILLKLRAKKLKINIGHHLFGESGLYILEGSIKSGEHVYDPKQILITTEASLCEFEIAENSTVYLFGGQPFPEEHFIFWNFVSSDKELIEKAKKTGQNKLFQKFQEKPNLFHYLNQELNNYGYDFSKNRYTFVSYGNYFCKRKCFNFR